MQFRGYRHGDVEAMVRLDALCFTEPFRFNDTTMREFAEADGSLVILAEAEEGPDPAGFIIVHRDAVSGYVVTIDVAKSFRRVGIGAALLQRVELAAWAAGASRMDLHVAVTNRTAIAFYERRLYERVARANGFYRQAGVDAFLYTKALVC